MPNHTYNKLTIQGDKPQLDAVKEAIKGESTDGDEVPLDFNRLIPMPDILTKTASGGITLDVDGEKLK